MPRTKNAAVAVFTATACLAASPAALAQSGEGQHQLSKGDLHGVPARVAKRLKRVERALDRAEDAIDDSDSAAAVTRLGAVDKNLARALKAVNRRSDDEDVTHALAQVTHDVIETTAADFDGQDSPVVEALATTLDGAVDDRDSVGVYADDAAEEADDVAEALADDELTTAAKAALESAATKLAAAAAQDSSDDTDTAADDDTTGDCPKGGQDQSGPTGQRGPNNAQQAA